MILTDTNPELEAQEQAWEAVGEEVAQHFKDCGCAANVTARHAGEIDCTELKPLVAESVRAAAEIMRLAGRLPRRLLGDIDIKVA